MSWKPAVKVSGENDFILNGLTFATEAEALGNARTVKAGWSMVDEVKAVEVDTAENPVNRKWIDGKTEMIK